MPEETALLLRSVRVELLDTHELRSLSELFREVPDYRTRLGDYPLCALLGLTACG